MRRFVDEIQVTDPDLAQDIIYALESKNAPSKANYEVELYDRMSQDDPLSNRKMACRFVLKIFIKEELKKEAK